MKLMIVDDHAETRRLIRELIGRFASSVCECASAEEALSRCAEFQPNFVTMDLNMKTIGGFEATRMIRAWWPATEVVVVAHSNDESVRRVASTVGASGYFSKDNLDAFRLYVESRAGDLTEF